MPDYRLNKVLKELNVSISRAVDYLRNRGVTIEANPNAKVGDEVYSLLIEEFQTDKKQKQASHDIVISKIPEKQNDHKKETPELIKAKAKELTGPKILEKIDLNPKPKIIQKDETTFENSRANIDINKKTEENLSIDTVEIKPEIVEKPELKIDISDTKIENIKEEIALENKDIALEKENIAVEKENIVIENIVDNIKETDDNIKPIEKSENIETSDTLETKYQKLDGPKFTGQTIDLSIFNKPKPSPKPVHDNQKNKRKRIQKDVNVNRPQTGNQNQNQGQQSQNQGQQNQNRPQSNNQNQGQNRPQFGNQNRQGGGQGGYRQGGYNNNRQNFRERKPVAELSDEEVKNQIKETLEKLTGKGGKSKGSKHRREKRENRREFQAEQSELERLDKSLNITEFITVNELASLMEVNATEVISACFSLGVMVTMNQRLDAETLTLVGDEFGFDVKFVDAELEETIIEEEDNEEDLIKRAPIVTVMGHVDHGKTSLLDYVRKANVIAGESGGITQHIGAYSVKLNNGEKITFLDTPGHEAFTAMRARGAQVTDIVIIVIAADDDVMPQTKEAISHAQAAGVPMIIAINKIDKPTANPEKIKEQLSHMNILVEDWGGKVQSQEISAKAGNGVEELLEKVLLEAEILELKANPNKSAQGVVIEASLDKGRGYVTTLLVQSGTMKIGDYILAGKNHGKVKAMLDERGKNIKEAKPSSPVTILGLDGAATAGDKFKVFEDEREAKNIASKREQLQREQSIRTKKHITLDELGRRIALGDFKELNIIIKGDVDGSVEALADSLQKLSNDEIHVNIILKGVGQITESDVLLASASDAIILGFNVRPNITARDLAEKEEVEIRNYSIIYDAINEVREAMEGLLSPEIKEKIIGNVEIREVFKITKVGTVAGCMVLDGKIFRNSKVRIIRDGVVIHEGELASLKRFKDDVKEVTKGYECGLNFKNFNNIEPLDSIEVYEEYEVKKKLK